ncbi:DUF6221 family protein [Streptomyces anulatus]|uniref:DUF6221 family protein n=1 Tax=Streptomyces anulatus TaxID=1892 RepID=UPI00343A4B95
MTDALVAFLRARLDDDAQVAREAAFTVGDTGYEQGALVRPPAQYGDALVADGQHWGFRYHQVVRSRSRGPQRTVAEAASFGGRVVAEHIAHHDPARVLREVEAKRLIVEAHGRGHECISLSGSGDKSVVDGKPWAHWEPEHTVDAERPCYVLRALVLPYADHPDYLPKWRP